MATKEVKAAERGEGRGGMRTGALVLGIIAGLAGLASAVFALWFGLMGDAFDANWGSGIMVQGWVALGFSLFGLIGAALSGAKPRLAALVMAVAGVALFIAIYLFATIATPLFLVGALLAFLGRRPKAQAEPSEALSGEAAGGQ
jgi:hypothetical protein